MSSGPLPPSAPPPPPPGSTAQHNESQDISLRSAPGTCCPEMQIKDGICEGCGKVYIAQRLDALYARIPDFKCLEGCSQCCGAAVPMLEIESERFKHKRRTTNFHHCPHLKKGKCDEYDKRPMICRMFGTSEHPHLRCPINKSPKKLLTLGETNEIMKEYETLAPLGLPFLIKRTGSIRIIGRRA